MSMNPTTPVTYTTPDGVTRPVRVTIGAEKRIAEKFGKPFPVVLNQYDVAALPDILYLCMFDDAAGGKPPKGLAPNWGDALEPDTDMKVEMTATLMAANSRGALKKSDLIEATKAVLMEEALRKMRTLGLNFGPSPDSVSESPAESSGPAPPESSTPSSSDSASASESETTAPV